MERAKQFERELLFVGQRRASLEHVSKQLKKSRARLPHRSLPRNRREHSLNTVVVNRQPVDIAPQLSAMSFPKLILHDLAEHTHRLVSTNVNPKPQLRSRIQQSGLCCLACSGRFLLGRESARIDDQSIRFANRLFTDRLQYVGCSVG